MLTRRLVALVFRGLIAAGNYGPLFLRANRFRAN